MSSEKIYFAVEAIINYPQVVIDKNKFQCCLYFTKTNFENCLKSKFDEAQKEFKKATLKVKKIAEENESVKSKLGEEYIYQHSANGNLDYIKCIDLYHKDFPLEDLKSGDRVYIKGVITQTQNPEPPRQKYISIYINRIAKVENQPYELYDEKERDKDFYDALDKYKTDYNTDPDGDDKMDWEE